jgi:hypothetical protein
LVLPPLAIEKFGAPHLRCAGTLKAWQRQVARPVRRSSGLMLIIAAAFAAPLVRITELGNFGLVVSGLTAAEQHVAAAVARSVTGRDPDQDPPGWWAPPNSLTRLAAGYADLLFVTVGGAAPTGRQGAARLQHERLQWLCSGQAEGTRPGPRWHGVFLTLVAGPVSPNGGSPASLEFPARFGLADLTGPEVARAAEGQGNAAKSWATARLERAAAQQYGRPLRAYLRHLIALGGALPAQIQQHRRAFIAASGQRGAERASCDVDRLASLYAAGCLAIAAGVLPWRRNRLLQALLVSYRAIARHRRKRQFTTRKIQRILAQRLRAPLVVRRQPGRRFGPERHAGFYDMVDGDRVFTVHARAFRRWFGGPAGCRAVLAWLDARGLLQVSARTARTSSDLGQRAERTPRWPDGRVQKSFVFRLPKPKRGGR